MDRKKLSRLCLFITTCSVVGVVLGGSASRADIQQCLSVNAPTNECLTQDPFLKTIEGMSVGFLAGAGAALGATWRIWQQEN